MTDSSGHVARALGIAAVLVVGVALRGYQLGNQQIMGDEIWTLRTALDSDLLYLLTHHHTVDFSIPLAVWDMLMIEMGGLSEWNARLPVLTLGCAMLLVAWRLGASRLCALEGFALSALVAVSPILILYSRFARPYIGVSLFVLVALLAWLRWLESARIFWALACAASAAVALFFNAVGAPAVIGMWASGVAVAWIGGDARETVRARPLASLGVAVLGGILVLVLYAPSLNSFVETHQTRSGRGWFTFEGTWGALQFLLGTKSDLMLTWAIGSIGWGGLLLARRSPRLLAIISAMALTQVVVIVVTSPHLVQWSYVLGRYLMPVLPTLLIPLGIGLVAQARAVSRAISRAPKPAAPGRAGVLLGLFLIIFVSTGPLPTVFGSPNAFTSHPDDHAPPVPDFREARAPGAYEAIGRIQGEAAVVEVPWTRAFRFTPYAYYQRIHGRPVWSATDFPLFSSPGLAFSTVRPVASLENRSLDADYVVIHKRVADEMLHLAPGHHAGRARIGKKPKVPRRLRTLHDRTTARALIAAEGNEGLTRVYEDEWVVVFATDEAASLDFPHNSDVLENVPKR
jgi:hypothetical protein